MVSDAAVADYIAFLETMTPESLSRFEAVFAPDARFRDPFNDAHGLPAIRRVFEKMFEDLDEHGFQVLDHAIAGERVYMNWRFRIVPKGKRQEWWIDGMSSVDFRDDGKVTAHIDHYDAASQIYEKFPFIGAVLRALRRRIAA